MEKRKSFDEAAKIYDESRPSYPDEVVDWIIKHTNISKEKRLLEIGAGTGQCTIMFAKRGYPIHCVELGIKMADILKRKTARYDVNIDVGSFEEWQPILGFKTPFIFCATAFHWIDPKIKYKKCYDLLEDDGYLVLLWNVALDSQIDEIKQSYEFLFSHYPDRKISNQNKNDIKGLREQEIIESGYFSLVSSLDYSWKLNNTREQLTKGFFSQSSFLSLDQEKKEILSQQVTELYQHLDDYIKIDFITMAFIAKKV